MQVLFVSSGFCRWLKVNRAAKITPWLCCPRTTRSCTAVQAEGLCFHLWGSCGPLSPGCRRPSVESRYSMSVCPLILSGLHSPPFIIPYLGSGEINTYEWTCLHTEARTTFKKKKQKTFPSPCYIAETWSACSYTITDRHKVTLTIWADADSVRNTHLLQDETQLPASCCYKNPKQQLFLFFACGEVCGLGSGPGLCSLVSLWRSLPMR